MKIDYLLKEILHFSNIISFSGRKRSWEKNIQSDVYKILNPYI